MTFWIKHPRNQQPDTMLTLSVLSTLTVLAKFALNGVVLTFGSKVINLGVSDAGLIGAVLTPTLAAYVARKMKDSPDAPPKSQGGIEVQSKDGSSKDTP